MADTLERCDHAHADMHAAHEAGCPLDELGWCACDLPDTCTNCCPTCTTTKDPHR